MPSHPPATWLPPIPGLHRRDPEHRYWLGDLEFPVSVTGVLSVLKTDYALWRIEETRQVWQPRGNACHRALELTLQLPDPGPQDLTMAMDRDQLQEFTGLLTGDYADWIRPLITHERWGQLQVIASERPTCCVRRQVAGTFDCAYLAPDLSPAPSRPPGVSGPTRVLADLKSLGENGSTYSTDAQLGGYMALEWSHGHWYDYGQTIWARPGKTTFSALHSRQECLLAWAGAWATWCAWNPPRGAPGGRRRIRLD
jgi:hypothetical protein